MQALPLRDRVVHHALIDPLEPWFDRRMIAHSYACRRGKGQHLALAAAKAMLRRHAWFLKMDVRSFFPSLDHEVVLDTLAHLVKDRHALALAATIVRGVDARAPRNGSGRGIGLPIGHLTSQWFANLVLDRLDHHVLEVQRAPGYVRYMDDFVVFGSDREMLCGILDGVREQLSALRLREKEPATILAPRTESLPFLGFSLRVETMPRFPMRLRVLTRVRAANLRRVRRRVLERERQAACGRIDERQLADAMRSVAAHLAHGDTLALRRSLWHPTPTASTNVPASPSAAEGVAGPQCGTDRTLHEPREPRRQFQQRAPQRAVGEPQQQRADDPQQQPRRPPLEDVTTRRHFAARSSRCAEDLVPHRAPRSVMSKRSVLACRETLRGLVAQHALDLSGGTGRPGVVGPTGPSPRGGPLSLCTTSGGMRSPRSERRPIGRARRRADTSQVPIQPSSIYRKSFWSARSGRRARTPGSDTRPRGDPRSRGRRRGARAPRAP
jgi:RNA-directed DNA polymerase